MVLFIAVFATLALTSPNIEWDLLPYIANATERAGVSQGIEQLHTDVYQNVVSSIHPEAFDKLINSPVRLTWYQDYEAFHQMTKFFYDTRVVYIAILSVFIKAGVNPVSAIFFLSTLYSVLSILILSRLVPVKVPLGIYIALPFIALSFGLLDVARLATPDAFATFATITLYALLLRNKITLLLFFLPLMVFIRTDLILIVGIFLTYFFVFRNVSKVAVIMSGLATMLAYFYLNTFLVDSDPWSSLIGYNFGPKPSHPGEYSYAVTVQNYIMFLMKGFLSFSYNPIGFVFVMLSVTGIVLYATKFFVGPADYKASLLHIDLLFLLVSSVLYLIAHFLLFPVTWTRFFAAQYSMVVVVVVWTTFSILAERNYSTREDFDLLS